jgi:hypothetical protein
MGLLKLLGLGAAAGVLDSVTTARENAGARAMGWTFFWIGIVGILALRFVHVTFLVIGILSLVLGMILLAVYFMGAKKHGAMMALTAFGAFMFLVWVLSVA